MKSLWVDENLDYDGSQLRTQFAYLSYKLMGDSIVAFQGRCDVDFNHMVDGEDLLEQMQIKGDHMLHFLCEVFHQNLTTGVALQRLFASLVRDQLATLSSVAKNLRRDGDDLFLENKKLSISVATQSPVSTMFHFAMNITNDGTPVPTCSLKDLDIDPKKAAEQIMAAWLTEMETIQQATVKVRPI